jgi:3-dehydroquinate dehydratase-1
MICVSLKETDPEILFQVLERIEFAEIRLDGLDASVAGVRDIFARHNNLIATCRPGPRNNKERKVLLSAAIMAGAAYVDIEVENDDSFKNAVIDQARRQGCKVIVSYHNFERTPDRLELEQIVDKCFVTGADIVKIACLVRSAKDNARILGILSDDRPLVVVGMGRLGKITRIAGPFLGSPFTYASFEEGKETAEGQINHMKVAEISERLKDA